MKKNVIVFFIHLLVCAFFSLDWSFFEGTYMGFCPTFLIVWGFTLPIITAFISIGDMIIQVKKKRKIGVLKIIAAVVGSIILLIYLLSAIGLLKNLALNIIYAFVFIGTVFIWGYWIYTRIKKK